MWKKCKMFSTAKHWKCCQESNRDSHQNWQKRLRAKNERHDVTGNWGKKGEKFYVTSSGKPRYFGRNLMTAKSKFLQLTRSTLEIKLWTSKMLRIICFLALVCSSANGYWSWFDELLADPPGKEIQATRWDVSWTDTSPDFPRIVNNLL